MIASLRGTIRSHDAKSIVVDVGGFGLRVFVGGDLLARSIGDQVELATYLNVSSDSLDLYGFPSEDERGLFESLLRVSGVGPKSALALISALSASDLRQAIIDASPDLLVRVPGIGKKTAERIILELSGTLAKTQAPTSDEAIDALERLGYTRREAAEALRGVHGVEDVRERIRTALKVLNTKP